MRRTLAKAGLVAVAAATTALIAAAGLTVAGCFALVDWLEARAEKAPPPPPEPPPPAAPAAIAARPEVPHEPRHAPAPPVMASPVQPQAKESPETVRPRPAPRISRPGKDLTRAVRRALAAEELRARLARCGAGPVVDGEDAQPAAGPTLLRLELELGDGEASVVDAPVWHVGADDERRVRCAQDALRGARIRVPGARPGARVQLAFPLSP